MENFTFSLKFTSIFLIDKQYHSLVLSVCLFGDIYFQEKSIVLFSAILQHPCMHILRFDKQILAIGLFFLQKTNSHKHK